MESGEGEANDGERGEARKFELKNLRGYARDGGSRGQKNRRR